jgi:hypothetical protein
MGGAWGTRQSTTVWGEEASNSGQTVPKVGHKNKEENGHARVCSHSTQLGLTQRRAGYLVKPEADTPCNYPVCC